VFRLTLRAAQGFIDSIFTLMNVPALPGLHQCQQAAQSRLMSVSTFTRGEIAHLVIDSTGLKVFGEGEKSKTRQRTPSYMAKVASGR
jgi:hypothetical protein